ncbi:MAG: aminoglycoside 3'-phosphotransferase/choline kinase family protein [Nanoarchaeota archaeon]|nr:aminoglycoside 3'-phosphotransferase/choline kinase family protein [Nanoarchaeota archaeon]
MDLKINRNHIQSLLKQHGLGKLDSLKMIKSGLSNPAFYVNDDLVLRISSEPTGKSFEKEKFLFGLVKKKTGLPVPQVVAIDHCKGVIPHTYFLLRRIPGRILSDCAGEYSEKQKKESMRQIGSALGRLHTIKFKHFGNFQGSSLVAEDSWKSMIMKRYSENFSLVKARKLMDRRLLAQVSKFVAANVYLLDLKVTPSLVHSDYSQSNILFEKGKLTGIIDFEWSYSGHSECDLRNFDSKFDKLLDYRPFLLEGYNSIIRRPKEYSKFESFYGIIQNLRMLVWVDLTKPALNPAKYIKMTQKYLSEANF